MKIWCPVCESESPESQERMRDIARYGLARFLVIARKARVHITMEHQRRIYSALLDWEGGGCPTEVDWIIHEYAVRAVYYAVYGLDLDRRLIKVTASMPPWDANYYNKQSWNLDAELRIANQLEPILREAYEWNMPEDDPIMVLLKQYRASRAGLPDLRNDAVDPEGDDID
jgi:hypothetical protein